MYIWENECVMKSTDYDENFENKIYEEENATNKTEIRRCLRSTPVEKRFIYQTVLLHHILERK